MSNKIELKIPDIGGEENVDVIEILVNVGDSIQVDDSLIALESDKATMEIPATAAGTIGSINVKVGDKVSEGDPILTLTTTAASDSPSTEEAKPVAAKEASITTSEREVHLPDLGTTDEVDVIELSVSIGDTVAKDDTLLTLEGDKATMEIPSPFAGKITQLHVDVGAKVTQGNLIAHMEAAEEAPQAATATKAAPAPTKAPTAKKTKSTPAPVTSKTSGAVYAGPAIRRFARELGVNLNEVNGSGRKGRITKEDVQHYVKNKLSQSGSGAAGLSLAPAPEIDFSKFGEVEKLPLTKINKLTGQFLHRNWLTIPHVTQFDSADITEMEEFRKSQKAEAEKQGYKLTPIVFIMKAVVATLKAFPKFNASLNVDGESLTLKKYFNIGIAVDTPNGLVVPVIRDVDQKELVDLAKELGNISKKAREKGLTPSEMQGGCFTISSLGGLGGTAFTPIVNLPEVAILGVSKASVQPVFLEGDFKPRLILPLSLSYDHRVIDGADGARFTNYLAKQLSDIRCLLL